MKILKAIGLIIAGILFLIVLISFFLPGHYKIERSIVINKNAAIPFALCKDFRAWDKWSPWHEIDTTMQKTYSETTGEVGSWYAWDSQNPDAGKGKVTITKMTENELIENELAFEGMGTSSAAYQFEPTAEGVKVTWSLYGDGSGMPWYMVVPSKYLHLMMGSFIGPVYEKGLKKLKEVSEATPDTEKIAGFDTEERIMNTMQLAGIRAKMKTSEMSSATFGKWFALLSQELSKQNIKPAGAPMTIYHQYGPKEVEVEAVIPVASMGNNAGNIVFRETTPTNVLVVKYYGDYNKVESVYMAAYDYIQVKGKSSKGAPMEIYITDPGMEKDTTKWLTEIVFPLD